MSVAGVFDALTAGHTLPLVVLHEPIRLHAAVATRALTIIVDVGG